VVLEPKRFESRSFSGRLYCTERALWKLNWFLRDFGYDTQLLKDDQVDEKALSNLRGVIRTSYTTLNGRSYQNLDTFAPEADWEALDCTSLAQSDGLGGGEGHVSWTGRNRRLELATRIRRSDNPSAGSQ
jgi:hypothetical protein